MCAPLLASFEDGRLAELERVSDPRTCPHYATSDLADAWHAGRAFERTRPADFVLGDVRKGRGYQVHAIAKAPFGRTRKLTYVVAYGDTAPRATETPASRDAWAGGRA